MLSEHQPRFIGYCKYCGAQAWYNPDLEKTTWKIGNPNCFHRLEEKTKEKNK